MSKRDHATITDGITDCTTTTDGVSTVTKHPRVDIEPSSNIINIVGDSGNLHPQKPTLEKSPSNQSHLAQYYGIPGWNQLFVLFFKSPHLFRIFTRETQTTWLPIGDYSSYFNEKTGQFVLLEGRPPLVVGDFVHVLVDDMWWNAIVIETFEHEKYLVRFSGLKSGTQNVDGKDVRLRKVLTDNNNCAVVPTRGWSKDLDWKMVQTSHSDIRLCETLCEKSVNCVPRIDVIHLLLAMVGNDTTDMLFSPDNIVLNLKKNGISKSNGSSVISFALDRVQSLFRDQSVVSRITDAIMFQLVSLRDNSIINGLRLSDHLSSLRQNAELLKNIQQKLENSSKRYKDLVSAKKEVSKGSEAQKGLEKLRKNALSDKQELTRDETTQRTKVLGLLKHILKEEQERVDYGGESGTAATDLKTGLTDGLSYDSSSYIRYNLTSTSNPDKISDADISHFCGVPYNTVRKSSKFKSNDTNWRRYKTMYYVTFVEEFRENPLKFITMLLDFEVLLRFKPNLPLTRESVAIMVWKQFAFKYYAPSVWMKLSSSDPRVFGSQDVWKRREKRSIYTKFHANHFVCGFTDILTCMPFFHFVDDAKKIGIGRVIRGNFSVIFEKLSIAQRNGDGSAKKRVKGQTKSGKQKQSHHAAFKCRPKKDKKTKFVIQQNGDEIGESLTLPGFKLEWDGNNRASIINVFRKKFIGQPGKWTEDYCGFIRQSGSFYPTYVFYENVHDKNKWTPGDGNLLKLLRILNNNFVQATAELGRLTGNCCCCSSELSDPSSLSKGFGPICEKRWDLTVDNKYSYLVDKNNKAISYAPSSSKKRERSE